MRKEELFEALEDIDPISVKEAMIYRGKKKLTWMKWVATAACATIIVGAVFGMHTFDYNLADFTPLTMDRDDLYLSKAQHAAMVEIDEHGVTGAAYTELAVSMGAAKPDDEIDFVLDRPFMFIVTGRDGTILFSGIVRNID